MASSNQPIISKALPRGNQAVTTCKMTGNYLVIAAGTTFHAFSLASYFLHTLQEYGNVIWSLAGDGDNLLVTGGTDGKLHLWDMKTK